MRLTRLGWGCLAMTVLTVLSAGTTGNNLLYLLYSAQISAMLLSWLAGRYNVNAVAAEAEFPSRIFRGTPFPLTLRLRNTGRFTAFLLRAGGAGLESVGPGAEGVLVLKERFPHRGMNRLDGVILESSFPFGLLSHRRELGPFVARAFPELREIRAAAEISPDLEVSGQAVAKKGMGAELYGARERDPSDDARLINWKLTAKSGKTMVNEYCGAGSSKITIRLQTSNEGAIVEAASAVRYHIDAGSEVRLLTPEEELGWGKGLLHLDAALELLARTGQGKVPRPSLAAVCPSPPAVSDSPGLRRLGFAASLATCFALFLIDEISPKLLLALIALVPAGWALHEWKGPRLPKVVCDAVTLAVFVFIVFFDWRLSGVAIANTHLIAYLLANRALVEVKTRELPAFFLILFLAFFLVSGLSISPWYFVFFLLYLALSGAWLFAAQGMRAARVRVWGPSLAGLLCLLLPLAAASFALTPRVERLRRMNPFVAMGLDKLQVQSSAAIGFTEDVTLGYFGALKKSTARVARVRPLGPWPEKPAPLLIRGAAYDRFDGRRWSKDPLDFRFRSGGRNYWTVQGRAWAQRKGAKLVFPFGPPAASAFEFVFYPLNLSVLFTAGGLSEVEVPDGAAFFDYTDSAYFAAPYAAGTRYKVTGAKSGEFTGAAGFLKGRFLRVPDNEDPRIAQLARQVAAPGRTDEEKARLIERHFRRTYAYSAYSDFSGRGLSEFLFTTKRGNCEYFASAAAILLRHAGIPSRLVTGFSADDWNEFGKFYDVRQGQAHAWTEAYAQGRWLTLDPTPPQGYFSSDLFTRRLARYADAIQATWYRNVIGYDSFVQRNTFFRMGQVFSWEKLWSFLRGLLLAAAWLGAALAAVFGVKRLSRGRSRVSGFFPKAQAALERAGVLRRPDWTEREFAGWVAARRPALAALSTLAELHYLERYRPEGLHPEERRRAEALLRELRANL